MTSILAVAAGGAVGSIIRWQLARWNDAGHHRGTLVANLAGTLLLALLVAGGIQGTPLLLLGGGLAGGLTTFSTVMNEAAVAPRRHAPYLTITCVLGLAIAAVVIRAG